MPRREKWTVDDIPNLTGKVVVVTGGNSGIGFGAVKAVARKGAETCSPAARRSADRRRSTP